MNFHWPEVRTQLRDLRRNLKEMTLRRAEAFHEKLVEIYVPQLDKDIQEQVPEDTGALALGTVVTLRKLKRGSSIHVSTRAYNLEDDYNYAYIQHEEKFSHEKFGAKDHFVSDPYAQMLEDIEAIDPVEEE